MITLIAGADGAMDHGCARTSPTLAGFALCEATGGLTVAWRRRARFAIRCLPHDERFDQTSPAYHSWRGYRRGVCRTARIRAERSWKAAVGANGNFKSAARLRAGCAPDDVLFRSRCSDGRSGVRWTDSGEHVD